MPRLSQVPRAEADAAVLPFYDALFGRDRDPVTQPGTATGTPGNWWTVLTETFRLIVVNLELEIDWFVVQAKSTSLALYSHLNRFFLIAL